MNMQEAARALATASEDGWAGFMRGELLRLAAHFADAAYSDAVFELLPALTETNGTLVAVCRHTRLLIGGSRATTTDQSHLAEVDTADLHSLVTMVQEIVRVHDEARHHASIRSIMATLQTYRDQKESFERLVAQAPASRADLMRQRFEMDTEHLITAIRRALSTYLTDQPPEEQTPGTTASTTAGQSDTVVRVLDALTVRHALRAIHEGLTRMHVALTDMQSMRSGWRVPALQMAPQAAACVENVERFATACRTAWADRQGDAGLGAQTLQQQLATAVAQSLFREMSRR